MFYQEFLVFSFIHLLSGKLSFELKPSQTFKNDTFLEAIP